jgi:hypothetical protein
LTNPDELQRIYLPAPESISSDVVLFQTSRKTVFKRAQTPVTRARFCIEKTPPSGYYVECVRPSGQGHSRGGFLVKSALFSKLSVVPFLVLAGMSGCGDTGGDTNNAAQGACQAGGFEPCQCPVPPGAAVSNGFRMCQPDGLWGACTCGGGPPQGTGGFGGNPNPGAGGQPPGGPVCGDGMVTGAEQCDGQNHNGQSCATVSMGACPDGYLACNERCIFEYSYCVCPGAGGQGGMGGSVGVAGTTGNPVAPVGGTTGAP